MIYLIAFALFAFAVTQTRAQIYFREAEMNPFYPPSFVASRLIRLRRKRAVILKIIRFRRLSHQRRRRYYQTSLTAERPDRGERVFLTVDGARAIFRQTRRTVQGSQQ